MSPEEQRIAIAKACGFKIQSSASQVPDYLKDLNAMHEAWLTLNADKRATFAEELAWIVLAAVNNPKNEFVFSRCSLSVFANATAAQRAEAFLRAKGLWKD